MDHGHSPDADSADFVRHMQEVNPELVQQAKAGRERSGNSPVS